MGKAEVNMGYGKWLVFSRDKRVYYISIFDTELNKLWKIIESRRQAIENMIRKINIRIRRLTAKARGYRNPNYSRMQNDKAAFVNFHLHH